MKLYAKFIIAYVIFGFLSFFLIATLTSSLTLKQLEEEKADNLYREAIFVASTYAKNYYTEALSLEELQTQLKAVDTYVSAPVWIIDTDGTILLNSREKLNLENPKVLTDFDPTFTGNQYYCISNFYDCYQEEVLSVISPITLNLKTRGYVLIHYPVSAISQERDRLLNVSYITLIGIFLLSLLILAAFTFLVSKPLKRITFAANQYAAGNLKYELPVTTDDEMGRLSATLNYMSTELSKMEEYQKKFVSNISHDFRSPLTSIKGYVEAILDGTIPPEMQEKYLNIVLFETERLNKLTSGLLTLNDFDRRGTLLDITDFDINSIIKKTAATFEGTCTSKRISIELIFSAKVLYVSADMGKIQQVLYNLIDNAIKFSNPDSVIYVETTEKHEKVFVSVKDAGIGIPKESLKKIWERFYKTDLSRGKDKKGTGLGLSITKEIIQAHKENINVISTEGVGTEFIFSLPRSKNIKSSDIE